MRVSVGGGTADSGTDYAAVTPFDVTIPPGAASGTGSFTLTPTQDVLSEGSETLDVTGASGDITVTKAEITLTDDDDAPGGITLTVDESTVAEDAAATTVTVTAAVDGTTRYKDATTVRVSVGGGTADSGTDYAAVTPFDVTIPPGAASGTGSFTLTPTQDVLSEGSETLDVTGASGDITVTKAEITLTDDDDAPGATLVLTPATIGESGDDNASTVTATLSGASSEAVTLTVSAGAGVTLSDNKVLTVAAGETASTGTVTLTAVDNDVDAADLSVTVSAAAAGGGVANPAAVTLTIADDDAPPVLSIDAPRVAEGDAGTATLTFAVGLSAASGRTVTVAYADAGTGTAAPGEDYAAVTAGTLTFAPGATRQTVAVAVSGDTTDEDDETVVLRLSSPAGATLDGGGTALDGTGTITDDDDAPGGITLSAEPTTVGEGAGGTTVTVTATVNGATRFAAEQTVTVSVGGSGSGDSATEGTDYAAVADFGIAIAAGAAGGSASFTLTPADDGVAEDGETVSIGGALAGVTVTGTSVTIDDSPTLTVTGVPERISDRTPFTAAFTFSEDVTGFDATDVTVTGGAKGAFAGSGARYTLVVTPAGDADVVVTVAADAASDGLNTAPAGAVSATAAWGAVLSIRDASGPEGSFLEFPVRLSQLSPDPVEVKWRTVRGEAWGVLIPQPDGSTWDGRDYDSGSGTLRFAPGETEKTVRVWANPDDGVNDPGETFFVDIHDPKGAELADPGNAYRLPLTPEVMGRVDVNTSRAVGTITGAMPAPLEVSVGLRHGTVAEGGSATVRVTATAPYGAHRPVRIPLTCGGGTAEPEDFACPTGLTIHHGQAQAQAAIAILQDGDADDETLTVSVGAPWDGTFVHGAAASVTLTVLDDDAPGDPGSDPRPDVDQDLQSLIDAVRRYAAETSNGPEHVKRWNRVLHALTDGIEGEAPPMTAHEAEIMAGTYSAERWDPVATALRKLEAGRNPYAGLTVSVADATAREGEEDLWFEITLNRPAPGPVTVRATTERGTARSPGDYRLVSGTVRFAPGERLHRLPVMVHDDGIDEGSETMELVLSGPGPDGVALARARATGTIINSDPLPAAWLARFGRTVAQQALDGIAGRVAAQRTPGLEAMLAGRALGAGQAAGGDAGGAETERGAECAMTALVREVTAEADGAEDSFADPFGCAAGETRSIGEGEALLGTAFTLTSGADGLDGTTAFWGRAARGGFDGGERDSGTAVTLDGTVTTVMLGADRARGRWLAGVALAHSRGAGTHRSADGGGQVEARITAAIPYGAWRTSERLTFWGAAGRGTGAVTLATGAGEVLSANTNWTMAAAGLRGDLIKAPAGGIGPALALTSDALWARTSSERVRGLAASDSAVTRLRLGLEGGWHMALESGGALKPRLEAGARHDGGDAETGFGIELGGGIGWSDPASGLSLDLAGRALVAHADGGLEDQGLSGSVVWDPAPGTERGPSLGVSQSLGGRAEGGLDALFAPDPLAGRTEGADAPRTEIEASWGTPALGGRFTGAPHASCGVSDGAHDCAIGWRLTPEARGAPDLSFGVRAARRTGGTPAPENTVGVELTTRW